MKINPINSTPMTLVIQWNTADSIDKRSMQHIPPLLVYFGTENQGSLYATDAQLQMRFCMQWYMKNDPIVEYFTNYEFNSK